MKAIILISSIFYILGLKFSNQIELVKKSNPADTIITNHIISTKPSKSINLKNEMGFKALADTLKEAKNSDNILEKGK